MFKLYPPNSAHVIARFGFLVERFAIKCLSKTLEKANDRFLIYTFIAMEDANGKKNITAQES